MSQSLLTALNAEQRAAVEHRDGPLLILAGPGSGKTRVVTHRVAYLLQQGVRASQILALTFTNKAADEMRTRLEKLAPNQSVCVGTFHRFGAQLLRRYAPLVGLQENYSILDADDSRKLVAAAVDDARLRDTMLTPDSFAHAISRGKNNLVTHDEFAQGMGRTWDSTTQRVYQAYQKRLLRANAVDFDDLLMLPALLLRDHPELRSTLDARYRYILVDEYQDTNLAQYALVRALSVDYPNLAVTGDPDQSIYGWRGANLRNILDFEHDYPNVKVVRLEENYRSTASILRIADQLITHNRHRKPKQLRTSNPEGDRVKLVAYTNGQDEAEGIAARIAAEIHSGRRRASDFAIFYRTNALSRAFEHALTSQHVPYQIVNGVEFYQRREVKDLLAYLHLLNNPSHDVALLRVINTPPRGIGKTTISRLSDYAREQGLPILDAARSAGMVPGLNTRAATGVARFVSLFDQLREHVTAPVEEIIGRVLDATGYRAHVESSRDDNDLDRLANVEELVTAAREFDVENPGAAPLERFLEQAALVNDTDALEQSIEKVTLMTLHGAKGLEFPVVFLVALEQGLLPHERSREDPMQLEEERRLLFVGITRAESQLQLSYANYRSFRGLSRGTVPSPFLMELPRAEMEIVEPSAEYYARPGRGFDDEFSQRRDDFADEPTSEEWDRDPDFADDDAVQWDPDDGPQRRPAKAKPKPPPKQAPQIQARLTTAADLLGGGGEVQRAPVDRFELGMTVEHPEYGPGRIIGLSGEGIKRQAVVRFLVDGTERRFRLQYSPLQPVRSPHS